MKNKGFTLIELMAIIIITSTIGILSYASLSSTIKNNKLSTLGWRINNNGSKRKSNIT